MIRASSCELSQAAQYMSIESRNKERNRLTLRPHDPKSCSEFATRTMPSQSMDWMSTSSYCSFTVGRKKTSLPSGFNRYLASTTRSAARRDNSYGFVGGT